MKNDKSTKAAGWAGAASGISSVLGSWQVCHNICLGLIALVAVFGITLTGMPLAFFTTIATPMWTLATVILIVLFVVNLNKKCISKNLLVFNSGFIIAGIPFSAVQPARNFLLTLGLTISGIALIGFVHGKFTKKKECCNDE